VVAAAAVLVAAAAIVAVAGFTVGGALTSVAHSLPKLDVADHQPLTQNTYIFDGTPQHHVLAVLRGDESRVIVRSNQISPLVKQAVVAIEDRRFYRHQGVDYEGIARALWTDVTAGRTVQGGSTITQQFIKNAYLPQEQRTEESFSRKIREAVLAYQLEKRWPKDKILTNYLNTIYFGHGAYGVEMAARTFFGRSARRLTLAQAALLAGVIRNPSIDDPFSRPAVARARRAEVLDAMKAQGMITAAGAAAAARAPLPPRPHALPKSRLAPYFVEYVIQQLVRQFGAATAFGGGLRVYTTLDPRLQRDANAAATTILDRPDDPAVSLVAIDPHSGEVKALVGGRDFSRQQFDIAVQGHRQPGSAFKPFALLAAIRQGMSPRTVFISEPKSIDMGPGSAPWNVSTYSNTYSGHISLADATVVSDNSVFADLSMMVGPENVAATAHLMGISSTVGDNPSIALGGLSAGVTPLEMATAYSTLASGGERLTGTMQAAGDLAPISIARVTDAHGNVLARNSLVRQRVLTRWQTGLATSILQQVMQRGTGTGAALGRPAAGKTGTTTNYADAWFCGYTPDLAASVWVGYPKEQRTMVVRGIHVAGGTFPAAVWRQFMSSALSGVPPHPFPTFQEPPVQRALVCARTGDLATRWCPERLRAFFYKGQRPTAFCTFHGPERVTVPNLVGLHLPAAQRLLTDLKLGWTVDYAPSEADEAGLIVEQRPAGAQTALQGTAVTLKVGAGPLQLVPNVVGLYREAAVMLLREAGFGVTVRFEPNSSAAPGTIARQDPEGGATAQGAVAIEVSGPDSTVVVPDVTGLTVADATAALAAAGLGASAGGDQSRAVAGQRPAAGTQVEIGSLVELTPQAGPAPSSSP